MRFPLVIVNFKTYPESTGENAVRLAEIIADVSRESGVSSAVAPQAPDIREIARRVNIPVLAQHVDPIKPGRNTGFLSPECVRAAGATGTLVNHSEHKLPLQQVGAIINRAREVGLVTVACTADTAESRDVARLSPDIIAVEPPELIGTGIPVSKARPEVVTESVRAVKEINANIRVLCGAGITKGEDVTRAMELGAEGVLIASGVVCAKDQRTAFRDIVDGVLAFRRP